MQKRQCSSRHGERIATGNAICFEKYWATYMWVMNTVFGDKINKEIEVYVDDVIIKLKQQSDHVGDLRKFFQRLCRYNLKLNPAKCAFGVPFGKLLGFIVKFDIIYVTRTAIKAQALANHLAKNLVDEEYEPLRTYFPNKEEMHIDKVEKDEKLGASSQKRPEGHRSGLGHGTLELQKRLGERTCDSAGAGVLSQMRNLEFLSENRRCGSLDTDEVPQMWCMDRRCEKPG
uniref:Uncharacterized protein LOC104245336 n=1 Tax=Nicotiana sylvestris TaxID=4096 RepID=A0A1U7Y7Z0_NICSY|nr:PREDICTED: uncharacterized protein LOC104245336 [Nicotiana sylvestris]